MSELLTSREAAALCRVSLSTFYAHVQRHLTPVRIGAAVRYRRQDLDAWLDLQRAGNSEASDASGASDSPTTANALSSALARVTRPKRLVARPAYIPNIFERLGAERSATPWARTLARYSKRCSNG